MIASTHNSTQQQTNFKNTAIRIGNHLAKEAIWDGDRCNWIGHIVDAVNGTYQVVQKSFTQDFYNGTSGIAYFLATLLRFHEDPILEDLLEGTINQVLSASGENDTLGSNFGFHGGRIGVAFSLKEVGKMRQRKDWIQAGDDLLDKICAAKIEDFELDVIAGAAGGIPILIKYYQESKKDLYLDTATRLGNFLVDKAEKNQTTWEWKTPMSSQALTGYSHGNAGIALALLELYAVTQNTVFYTGAMYGFNYERTTYNPSVQNWPDLREMGTDNTKPLTYGEGWCHGAPGIALSRLRAYELTGDNSFQQEAEIALATTYKNVYKQLTQGQDTANFSLCHGLAGNVDILLEGVQKSPNPLYQQIAEQAGNFGIEKHDKTGLSWLSGVHDPTGLTKGMGENPGFMLGISGTGYFYLRLAFPGQVESKLVL